jgi:hypothetical protein
MDVLDEAQKKAQSQDDQIHTVPDLSELLTPTANTSDPAIPQETNSNQPAFDISSFDLPTVSPSSELPSKTSADLTDQSLTSPTEPVPPEPAPTPPAEPVIQNFGTPDVAKESSDPLITVPSAQTPPPPPKKKNSFKRAFLFAGVAFLLLAVPVIGFFVNQQREIGDTRSKAAESCQWCAGPDQCFQSTGQRGTPVSTSLCATANCCTGYNNSSGGAQPQPTNPPAQGNGSVCESGGATARVCYGVTVGNNCNGFNGTCVKNGGTNAQGYAICGCVASSPTPNCIADGLELPTGKNCCSGRGYSNADTGGKTICGTTTATPRSARPTNTPNPTGSSSCGGLNEACCVRSTCDTGLRCENVAGSTIGKCIASSSTPTSCKTTGNSAPSCNGRSIGFDNGSCTCQISTLGGGDCLCRLKSTSPTSPANPAATATPASTCFVDNPSVTDSYINIPTSCTGSYTINKYEKDAPPGTTSSQCVGTSTPAGTVPFTKGTSVSPSGACGKCVQIDVNVPDAVNGGTAKMFGTAKYTGDCTSPPVAQCQNIKIYRNGTILTTDKFNTIKSGQQLVLAVAGANATKARFTVNTQLPIETTTKNNTGEYTITYTVPNVTTATTFTIQAEVFGNNAWK